MEHDVVVCDTALLIPHTVTDLEQFLTDPSGHLLSITADPDAAARLWHDRLRRNPYGGEGVVSVSYAGQALLGPEHLDHVSLTWDALVAAVEDFVAAVSGAQGAGAASGTEAVDQDDPAAIAIERVPGGALFRADDRTVFVDPALLIPGLVDGAAAFTHWVHEHLGTSDAPHLDRLAALRAAWASAHHRA
ncbi:MAG: hypothetical protein Q4G34_05950 [Micrococcus sp.]|nr:hypothetical protein [Micrococcus sp.]